MAREEDAPSDLAPLLDAASDFASYPGMQNDASVKEFLDRFPLPVIFGTLQNRTDVPGLEGTLVACLERIFTTRYGASFISQYVPFVQAGLQANSQLVRCLACKVVSYLLENVEDREASVELIIAYDIYPLLICCLLYGNEQVATASMDAIKNLAQSSKGLNVIFPSDNDKGTDLKCLAANCSSLARIRVLALIAKLFSLSHSVASIIYDSNLLSLFEAEVSNRNDMLMTLTVLELLYELAESPHSTAFLLKTTLLQLLASIISNGSVDSILRSRAILISGRLLSSMDGYNIDNAPSVKTSLLAIDERLKLLKDEDTDECESSLEALGQIGASIQGAALLLTSSSPVARHVVAYAFNPRGRGKQLAALHALGNISGVDRSDDCRILNDNAEECLRRLIYVTAANSSKLTPSGLFLSVLQQEPETRLAAYRLIAGLVSRSWCFVEVCSKQEIIDIVVDANMETSKNGMEARYQCCMAINKALSASNKLTDPTFAGIAGKLQEAVKSGPYLVKKKIEAQPVVMTAERF